MCSDGSTAAQRRLKQQRLDAAEEILRHFKQYATFLDNVVTGNEMRMFRFHLEKKPKPWVENFHTIESSPEQVSSEDNAYRLLRFTKPGAIHKERAKCEKRAFALREGGTIKNFSLTNYSSKLRVKLGANRVHTHWRGGCKSVQVRAGEGVSKKARAHYMDGLLTYYECLPQGQTMN